MALNWTVLLKTESAWLLALVNAYRLAPALFLSVPAGMLADRFDRRNLLRFLYLAVCLLTVGVGWALLTDQAFWLVALLVVARACLMTMDPPIRNAFMADLVQGQSFSRAVAWNASTMNLGRTVGPLLAGVLLAQAPPAWSFALAALAIAAVPVVLVKTGPIEAGPPVRKSGKKRPKAPISEAVRYLRDDAQARYLMLLAVPAMLFGFPYVSMLPLITKDLLGLGSEGFGTLLAVSALGSLAATTWLGSRPDSLCHGRFLVASLFAFSGSLVLLVIAPHYLVAAALLFLVGFSAQYYRTSSRMLLQSNVPGPLQGRVVSLALLDRGLIPLGALLVGGLATLLGPLAGSLSMGLGCGICTLLMVGALPRLLRLSLPEEPTTENPPAGLRPAKVLVSSLVLCMLPLFSGCAGPAEARAPERPVAKVTVEHHWGTTEVPLEPRRIVVLDLSFLDCLYSLGVSPCGFAGTSQPKPPQYLLALTPTGRAPIYVGERKQPNLEVIMALEPDLILANPRRHRLLRKQLSAIAPTVALADDSFEEVMENLNLLGRVTGKAPRAAAVEGRLKEQISQLQAELEGPSSVLVAGAFEDEFTVWTADSFVGSLFEEMGLLYAYRGPSMASESQTQVAKLTIEGLRTLDPENFFVYGDPRRWHSNPVFEQLAARRHHNYLVVDRDLWSRSRGPLAAEKILTEARTLLR